MSMTSTSMPLLASQRLKGASQRGVSLVELLVGVAIGLLVALAALGVISFSRISSTTVTDTVRLQQDAGFIMRIIGLQLRQARSIALQDNLGGKVVYSPYTGTIAPGAPGETAVFGTEGGGVALPDTITIGTGILNNLTTDCLGFLQAPADTLVSTFDVNGNALRCRTPANTEPLVDNVEDFQVWYGVRNPATANLRYLNANQVGAANWATVGAVMVCIRMSGRTQSAPNVGAATPGCQPNEAIPRDGRVRRVYRQIFTLRNPA